MEYIKIRTIYVDMDGVLADFKGYYKKLFCRRFDIVVDNIPNTELWGNIDNYGKSKFFEELPWISGSKEMWRFINKFAKDNLMSVKILSALGKYDKIDNKTSKGKRNWLKKHLPELEDKDIYLVENKHVKCYYSKPGSIIIDDTPIVIQEWIKKGGIGILFKNAKQVIDELNKYLYDEF